MSTSNVKEEPSAELSAFFPKPDATPICSDERALIYFRATALMDVMKDYPVGATMNFDHVQVKNMPSGIEISITGGGDIDK